MLRPAIKTDKGARVQFMTHCSKNAGGGKNGQYALRLLKNLRGKAAFGMTSPAKPCGMTKI
jgi:hypothetical protein